MARLIATSTAPPRPPFDRAQAARRVGIVSLTVTVLLCALALSRYGALDFARMGEMFCCGSPTGSSGYDGQFALYIAAFGANATPFIDGPTLRYQRILYPVTARALALGNPGWAAYTLIAVNVIAHAVGAGLLGYLLGAVGKTHGIAVQRRLPWMALAFTFWFGGLIAVRLDLNEPLCMALALGAVVAYLDRRDRLTAALLILSTLTKEIGLVFAAGLALHAFFNGERARAVYLLAAPGIAFLAWWGVLYLTFGTLPTRYPAARNLLPVPFNGLFAESSPVEFAMLVFWLAAPTLMLTLAAAWRLIRHGFSLSGALMLAAGAWVMLMPDVSWVDPAAAYRVAIPLIPCGLLWMAEHAPRRVHWLFALWLTSLLVALITPGMWF
ncbi:MAG: hypothetical protein SF162_15375 [bacterium]|nr:hypothetical protein [bacterium]